MNRKTLNLVLGAVALALIGVVAFQQHKDEKKDETPQEKGEPLTALAVSAIDHVALRHTGAADILLERKDGRWNLTAPVDSPADSVEVGRLLAIANAESRGKIDLDKVSRPDFGLDPAQFTLTLNDTVFTFGEVEHIRFLRYVEVDAGKPEDRIALITNPDETIVDADYTDLLSKKILPLETEITAIELPGLRVERKDKVWASQPADEDATQDNLQEFVDTWKRAAAIRTEIAEAPKGESKNLMAKVMLADGSTRSFLIVNRSPQLILDYAPFKTRYRLAPDISAQMLAIPKSKPQEAPAPASAEDATKPKADDADPKKAGTESSAPK